MGATRVKWGGGRRKSGFRGRTRETFFRCTRKNQIPKWKWSSWAGAVEFTHALLAETLGIFDAWRSEHIPLMMNKRIIADLNAYFGAYYNTTSSHHTRQRNEVQTEFAYVNWLVRASDKLPVDSQLYRSKVIDTSSHRYISYGKDTVLATRQLLEKTLNEIDTFLPSPSYA